MLIPGNHDKSFQYDPQMAMAMLEPDENTTVLVHQEAEVMGLRIFGSPWTPEFHNWAFNYYPDEAEALWKDIPESLDILITHGPPLGIGDEVLRQPGLHTGCPTLMKTIQEKRPRYHLFGHIHEGRGHYPTEYTQHYNAASMDVNYIDVLPPMVIKIPFQNVGS